MAHAAPITLTEFDPHEARMEKVFIGIAGLIGAGKSTLAKALSERLGLPTYYEPVQDNVYLEDFYKDIAKHAFAMQVYLLNRRFSQQQQIIWSGKGGVQDRTIYEDSVFAKMLMNSGFMSERDYATYVSLFQNMSNFMKKPNIIVYLYVTPEESLRRIELRGRECERSITIEYLRALHDAYEEFIDDISRVIPVIKVNYATFRSVDVMASAITAEYRRIQNIRYVDFADGVPATPTATPTAVASAGGGGGGGGGAAAPTAETTEAPDAAATVVSPPASPTSPSSSSSSSSSASASATSPETPEVSRAVPGGSPGDEAAPSPTPRMRKPGNLLRELAGDAGDVTA